jgi:DNA-binding protein HU-beta
MSDKITFKELVEKISAKTEQSEQSTNDFIHELAGIIEASLGSGEKISIAGFGKFELRWMDERKGRNPQTGEEMTIPGQNKVVFKPYKALRQSVNKPFENLESQVIGDEPDDDQSAAESPVLSNSASSIPTSSMASKQPVSKAEQTENDLIIERDSPVSNRARRQKLGDEESESSKPADEAKDDLESVINQQISRQETLARDVQKNGGLRWSYTAAAIVVMLAIFLIIFLWNQPDQSQETEISSIAEQPGITQVDDLEETEFTDTSPEVAEKAQNSGDDDSVANQSMDDAESVQESGDEIIPYTVAAGESLWTIAQNQYNNPYLWPLIYAANQNDLENPNLLLSGNNLDIPTLENPDNLSQLEREKVALGYISVYDWILNNQPENARYYLWAAGSFSQEVLRDASDNVNEADLAFATQG